MKRSEIYRKAARMVFANNTGCKHDPRCGYTCCALSTLTAPMEADNNEEYYAVRNPYRDMYLDAEWWNAPWTPENQQERVLALCFMAAIAESEESA